MPELPEVETIRRDLAAIMVGSKIISVDILSPGSASHSAAFFRKELIGRKIVEVGRRGKLLIFRLSPSAGQKMSHIIVHLKMTGQLVFSDKKHEVAGGHSRDARKELQNLPSKHTRAVLKMADGGKLFFNDLRRFGYIKLVSQAELDDILARGYGPEPLTVEFTFPIFEKTLRKTNMKIKAALLNQKIIAGLGNIYTDEVLWAARIRPDRPVGKISQAELKKLQSEINRIIRLAVKHRGTTFSDYVDSSGRRGGFSKFLKVYGRAGAACPNCRQPLKKTKIAGRGTHYCPICQK
jgi:formamidopyrimidine-DNA glycosylase